MRLATAWLTVKILSPYTINLVYQYKALKIRIYNAVFDCQKSRQVLKLRRYNAVSELKW